MYKVSHYFLKYWNCTKFRIISWNIEIVQNFALFLEIRIFPSQPDILFIAKSSVSGLYSFKNIYFYARRKKNLLKNFRVRWQRFFQQQYSWRIGLFRCFVNLSLENMEVYSYMGLVAIYSYMGLVKVYSLQNYIEEKLEDLIIPWRFDHYFKINLYLHFTFPEKQNLEFCFILLACEYLVNI